jgi:hypothetical protein
VGRSPLSIPNVVPGGHVLTARLEGGESVSKPVEVPVNKIMAVELALSTDALVEEEGEAELVYLSGEEIAEETRSALQAALVKKHPKYNAKDKCYTKAIGKKSYCVNIALITEENAGRDNTYLYVAERDTIGSFGTSSIVILYKFQQKREGLVLLAEQSFPIAAKQGSYEQIDTYRVGSGLGLGWMVSSKTLEDGGAAEVKGYLDLYMPVGADVLNVLKFQSSSSIVIAGNRSDIPYYESELSLLEVEGRAFHDLEVKRIVGYENSDKEPAEFVYQIPFDAKKNKYILPRGL